MAVLDEGTDTFRFKASRETQERLARAGIFLGLQPGVHHAGFEDVYVAPKVSTLEPYVTFAWQRNICQAGFASFIASAFEPLQTVGRYCSIASGSNVMAPNHPIDRFTTHSITYGDWSNVDTAPRAALGGAPMKLTANPVTPRPTIGHDVWLGQAVLLARNISIGSGSVVAAGSVVTHDVPPYAIVAGNPARIIKFRFPEKLIEKFLKVRWWRYAFPHFAHLDTTDPETFLDALADLASTGGISEYAPHAVDLYSLISSTA